MNINRWSVLVLFAAACTLSAAAGFWFGFREAWWLSPAADSMPRGALSLGHIRSLARGKPEYVVTFLESDVDNGLVWGYEVLHHPLRNFLSPVWGIEGYPETYEKYAVRLANYRVEHPSPVLAPNSLAIFSTGETAEEKVLAAQLAEGRRQVEFKLDAMLKRYTSKP